MLSGVLPLGSGRAWPPPHRLRAIDSQVCGRRGGASSRRQDEDTGLGFGEDASADQAFRLGPDTFGVTGLRPGAQRLADVLRAERAVGLLESGQDLVVSWRERLGRRETVLGGQFQDGLADDPPSRR
ncbi:hypothetical protein [Streptomyces sp. NPDC051310]|uniref:hypothetical protein n=1 Tax=Streptomyces sp. NPDC051310 TaxID=3365649 RepID=UPI0037B34F4A